MDFPERLTALQPLWGVWMLDGLLGEGSYGKVYRIKREEMGETTFAALKWISLPKSQTELDEYRAENMTDDDLRALYRETVRQFREEIVLMNRLRGNSHVVNYEDHLIVERKDEVGWDILIRMELLTPLNKRFRDGMTIGDVVKLGLDLCDGLALCAKAKIIHRDIKTDNIFVSPYGEFKLGDFGVARSMERTATHLSRQGTPLYMAPEVYLNRGVYDATVDLYSLALVMHRMLNRQRLPFLPMTDAVPTHAERNAALETRLSGVPIPPPLDGGVELAKVICKAASFDPRKRYQSPEQMREALQNAAAKTNLKQPLTANPTGAGLNSGRSSLKVAVSDLRAPGGQHAAEASGGRTADDAHGGRHGAHHGWRNVLFGVVITLSLASIGFGLWMNRKERTLPQTASSLPVMENSAAVQEDSPVPTEQTELSMNLTNTSVPVVTQMPLMVANGEDTDVQGDALTLENALRKALGLAGDAHVTDEQAASVTELDLQDCGLTDISILSECTGLKSLNLSDNGISDLKPISRLKNLTTLQLWNNSVNDISPLINLTNLQTLDLGKNAITNVYPLQGMTKLEWLGLSYNSITTITPLKGMAQLTFLGIGYNRIGDISTLAELPHLEELWLVGNLIRDVAPLAKLTLLHKLSIAENPVEDYAPLTNVKLLKECDVAEEIATAKADAQVEKVVRAYLRLSVSQPITDAYAASVSRLDLSNCNLTDISYLSKFTGLKVLYLNKNQISDISPLARMTGLEELSIYLNKITDINALGNLTALRILDLEDNQIKDATPLAKMSNLETLWIGNNLIQDITPLQTLTLLKVLHLRGNPVKGTTALAGLGNLKEVDVSIPQNRKKVTYALVTDGGDKMDGGYNQDSWDALVQFAQENGLKEDVDYAAYQPHAYTDEDRNNAIDDAIQNGSKVIILSGLQWNDPVISKIEANPSVCFLGFESSRTTWPQNMTNITFCEENSGYFAGYAAVKDGFTKLGFLGGMEVPAVTRFGYGFIQGADAAAKDMYTAIEIKFWYSGTFEADEKIVEKMKKWYSEGTELVFACGGDIIQSCITAANAKNGRIIGVDRDQSGLSERIITSAIKDRKYITAQLLGMYKANPGAWPTAFAGHTVRQYTGGIGLPTDAESWRFRFFSVDDYQRRKDWLRVNPTAVSGDITERPATTRVKVDYQF